MVRHKAQIFIKFRRQQSEYKHKRYALLVAGRYLRCDFRPKITTYHICSVDKTLPDTVECDGVMRKVHIVLKLYVKIPVKERKKARDERYYNNLVAAGRPLFYND